MATKTFGSNAVDSFTALPFKPGYGSGMAAADIATIEHAIIGNRSGAGEARLGGRFDSSGILYLPGNQGEIRCNPGDYVVVDDRGWPFVVRADSITNGAWTHS